MNFYRSPQNVEFKETEDSVDEPLVIPNKIKLKKETTVKKGGKKKQSSFFNRYDKKTTSGIKWFKC